VSKPQSLYGIVLAVFTLLCWSLSQGTVLTDYSLDELIGQSSLIVEGEVLSHTESRDAELIYTTIELQIDEVLKGDSALTRLPLKFIGGGAGSVSVEVSGQFIPGVGERGVFFISDPYLDQVNPLTGWYQGFFRELQIPGDPVVYLDLHERPDLILVNLPTDPMLKKLLGLGVSEADIAARFPAYQRFPAADFKDYIRFQARQEGR